MKTYYAQLQQRGEGVSTLDALNAAKRAMLERAEGKYSCPFYWGAVHPRRKVGVKLWQPFHHGLPEQCVFQAVSSGPLIFLAAYQRFL